MCLGVSLGLENKPESLLEFLVLQKHPRVAGVEKHQPHFLYLVVSSEEIPDRSRRDRGRVRLRISERTGRDGGKSDGGDCVLARDPQGVLITRG